MVVPVTGEGGCRYSDVGDVPRCSGAGVPYLWLVDAGYFQTHWEDAGQLLPQGVMHFDGAASEEEDGWDVGLPPTGRVNGGVRPKGGGDLRHPSL